MTLSKDGEVRLDFGRFLWDGEVDYRAIPVKYLTYAALDAIATYKIGTLLAEECRLLHPVTPLLQNGTNGTNGTTAFGPLSHHIQLRGDIALADIRRLGISVDNEAVNTLSNEIAAEIARLEALLLTYGYKTGTEGVVAIYETIVTQIEQRRGEKLPRTKTGKVSQAEDDLLLFADEPFVDAILKVKGLSKIEKTYLEKFGGGGRVYPEYTLLLKTGRTSCRGIPIQALPREGHVRECLVAAAGHVLIDSDYSMLQLCTLAQIAYDMFGHSRMRDLINEGVDLHRFVAGQILGKAPSEVTKDERQKAKAVNFGLPGGMGVSGLRAYAASSYGVRLGAEEVASWRNAWLDLFPEMKEYLRAGDDLYRLGNTLDLNTFPDGRRIDETTAAMIVVRIAGGAKETSAGRAFTSAELDWAWEQIANSRAARIKALVNDVAIRRGSRDLQQAVKPRYTVAIPTGRVRADCSYTESRNCPFQALEGDGAKLALYDLVRAGFRVVAFVHDEVLVEVPEAPDYRPVVERISEIMVAAMRCVCPDVEIKTESVVTSRWSKSARPLYDADNRLLVDEPDTFVDAKNSALNVGSECAARTINQLPQQLMEAI